MPERMDIEDKTLIKLCRISPEMVPLSKIGVCLPLLDSEGKQRLLGSLTKRRPRSDRERRILLYYASHHGVGGVLFIDALGGFEGLRPC